METQGKGTKPKLGGERVREAFLEDMASNLCPELSWVSDCVRVGWQGERERKGGYGGHWPLFKATQHLNPSFCIWEAPHLVILDQWQDHHCGSQKFR